MDEVKRIDLNEFREFGFLQEVNRQFFHPLGLALAVIIEDLDGGAIRLDGVWDYREDPEGILYVDGIINEDKIKRVASLRQSKLKNRTGDKFDADGIQLFLK